MPYNNIPDAEIDPDSPVTASLMQKLRDNPIGIAQAAAGAPKVQYNALNGSGITHAFSTGSTINFSPFAHTPTGTVTHLVFLYHTDIQETGSSAVTVYIDGSPFLTVSTAQAQSKVVFDMRVTVSSNAAHAFTFAHEPSEGTFSCTIVSIAS
jgi:hypothetical protein